MLTEAGLTTGRDVGRERHYRLAAGPLREVRDYLDELERPGAAAAPPIPESALDALDTEVRRTVRERRFTGAGEGPAIANGWTA